MFGINRLRNELRQQKESASFWERIQKEKLDSLFTSVKQLYAQSHKPKYRVAQKVWFYSGSYYCESYIQGVVVSAYPDVTYKGELAFFYKIVGENEQISSVPEYSVHLKNPKTHKC